MEKKRKYDTNPQFYKKKILRKKKPLKKFKKEKPL